jgi:hypothetical protein
MAQTSTISVPYLKASCWYVDRGKIICLVEEEDIKKACGKTDLKGAALGSDHGEELKEMEMDLNLFFEKKRNKIFN